MVQNLGLLIILSSTVNLVAYTLNDSKSKMFTAFWQIQNALKALLKDNAFPGDACWALPS